MLSAVPPVQAGSHIIAVEQRRLVISINPASALDIADVLDGLLPGDITRFLISEIGEDDHCWLLYAVEYAEDVDAAGSASGSSYAALT